MGYVGIPLSVASAEAGFNVTGVDVDQNRVAKINSGVCYVEDLYSERLLPDLVKAGKIRASENLKDAAESAEVVIICVPTPLDLRGDPDLSYVRSVARGLSKCLSNYKIVILESTSFPGTTRDIVGPLLEQGGKKAITDFALAYSPERIDYGNPRYSVKDITKIVGGIDQDSTRIAAAFYRCILKAQVVEVSNPSVAEAAKILENIFRYVNIALVNELSVLHEELGVDFIEAISAAATKPFGFMAHYPGPGIGGHCIPKDPFYLVYKAKKAGLPLRLVSAAKQVNSMMPAHVVSRLVEALQQTKKRPIDSRVVVWGLAYKGEVRDTRRSPALEVIRQLQKKRVGVRVYDPYVEAVKVNGRKYASSASVEESVADSDCIVLVTSHNVFRDVNLSRIRRTMRQNPILFDARNLLLRADCEEAGFTYLATGRP